MRRVLIVLTLIAGFSLLYLPPGKPAPAARVQKPVVKSRSAVAASRGQEAPPSGTPVDAEGEFHTVEGILHWTNAARQQHGLPELTHSGALDRLAQQKLDDMFDREYFAHVSPLGEDIAQIAAQAGYRYIYIGENLAKGGIKNDRELVAGWMNSPGHRANILKKGYTELGIAVDRREFEDKQIWLAVQVFGTPESHCPPVDPAIRRRLEIERARVEEIGADHAELNALIAGYNELIKAHEACVRSLE